MQLLKIKKSSTDEHPDTTANLSSNTPRATLELTGDFGGNTVAVMISLSGKDFVPLLDNDVPVVLSEPSKIYFVSGKEAIQLQYSGNEAQPAVEAFLW